MSGIVVRFSKECEEEKRYIIHVLLGEFLGLEYQIELAEIQDYEIHINDKTLRIRDELFHHFPDYLTPEAIPAEVKRYKGVPILYGKPEICQEGEGIECLIDIFGSSFFMLSRFEERITPKRDEFGRFPESEVFCIKHGFAHQPVVNYYAEWLWEMLAQAGFRGERKKWDYRLLLTHDIDSLYFWSKATWWRRFSKAWGQYHNYKQALKELLVYLGVRIGALKDPWDKFDYFMNIARKLNTKAHFFFMSGGCSEFDNRYAIGEAKGAISKILHQGHIVGIHPSYNSYNSPMMLEREKRALGEASQSDILCGRQHYLRFNLPLTWRLWEEAGMEWDSTMGFSEYVGFRCGVCYPFSVFDVEQKRHLKLIERSLVIMDCALPREKENDRATMRVCARNLTSECKKFGGEMVILWHNSSFSHYDWAGHDDMYEALLDEIL